MTLKKKTVAILSVIVASATTAALDWTYAKIEEYVINVPIATPIGVIETPVTIEEKVGRISNHRYSRRVK